MRAAIRTCGALGARFYVLAGALALCAEARGADALADSNVTVTLIAEHATVTPGQPAQLGLHLRHAPHWHTYWINPGDSGLATTLTWTLPPGFRARDIEWPLPRRFDVGGLYNFGYDGDVVLPVTVDVPAVAVPGSKAHAVVEAKWLVCREACIPGKASLALDLPVETAPAKPDPRWTPLFAKARLAEPEATAWKAQARVDGEHVTVTLRGPDLPDAKGLDAFVDQKKIADNKPPAIRRDRDALTVDFGKSEYFAASPATFDLVVTKTTAAGLRGWRVEVPVADASSTKTP